MNTTILIWAIVASGVAIYFYIKYRRLRKANRERTKRLIMRALNKTEDE
jgi:hypothetical protein